MNLTTKAQKIFWDRVRIDEDDMWIWQGHVEKGVPMLVYDGVHYDAREFAFYVKGLTPPTTNSSEWANSHGAKLDCNPAHNTAKIKNSNKYRGIENEDMGKPSSRGDSAITGDGISESTE